MRNVGQEASMKNSRDFEISIFEQRVVKNYLDRATSQAWYSALHSSKSF